MLLVACCCYSVVLWFFKWHQRRNYRGNCVVVAAAAVPKHTYNKWLTDLGQIICKQTHTQTYISMHIYTQIFSAHMYAYLIIIYLAAFSCLWSATHKLHCCVRRTFFPAFMPVQLSEARNVKQNQRWYGWKQKKVLGLRIMLPPNMWPTTMMMTLTRAATTTSINWNYCLDFDFWTVRCLSAVSVALRFFRFFIFHSGFMYIDMFSCWSNTNMCGK